MKVRRRGRDDDSIERASKKAKEARRASNRQPRRSSKRTVVSALLVVHQRQNISVCSDARRLIVASKVAPCQDIQIDHTISPPSSLQINRPLPKDIPRFITVPSMILTPRPFFDEALRARNDWVKRSKELKRLAYGSSSAKPSEYHSNKDCEETVIPCSLPF